MPWKKLVLFTAIFFLLTFASVKISLATNKSPIERVEDDYALQFTKYREAQEKYTTARAAYISFQTVASKNDAFLKTQEYLVQIDKLYISYLDVISEYSNHLDWTSFPERKTAVGGIVESQKNYFNDHQKRVLSAAALEGMPPLAGELKKHLDENLNPQINKVLAIYEIAQSESLLAEFNILASTLDQNLVERDGSAANQSIIANWKTEVEDIRKKAEEAKNKAFEKLAALETQILRDNDLEGITTLTQKAIGELKRSSFLFGEVVNILNGR